jgi:hypothetical protein
MATYIVFSKTDGTNSGGNSATYSTARAMSGASPASTDTFIEIVGQNFAIGNYLCYENFMQFDTSALTAGATVTGVSLNFFVFADASSTDFTVEARMTDWGTTLTTADSIAGASLSGLTRVATVSTSGISTSAYTAMAEDGTNFQTNINRTGDTRLMLSSSRQAGNNTPSGNEYLQIYQVEAGGTASDPFILVTFIPQRRHHHMMMV